MTAVRRAISREAGGGVALGAVFVVLALLTGSGVILGSGFDLGANTWVDIALTLIGAGALVGVLLWSEHGPARGAPALLAFTAFAVLTALSIIWSWQPDASWSAANETVAYLAVFAIGLAGARLLPGHWRWLLVAVALSAIVISAIALAAKVFSGLPLADPTLGRLTSPLGYWNAIGLLAAMGLAPCLWLGALQAHPRLVRTAMVPAVSLLGAVVILSYSRSALAAGIIILAGWFALVPLRLRAAALFLPGLAGAAVISAWALAHPVLTDNHPDIAARGLAAAASAGHDFGIVVGATLVVAGLIGAAIAWPGARVRLTCAARRWTGGALLALAALVPIAGVVKLARSSRGLFGEIAHLWDELTSTRGVIGTNPNRLVSIANSRPIYWHAAIDIGRAHLLHGVGALGYATARYHYTTLGEPPVNNAHGFAFETFADLGLIGVAVMLALLLTWAVAVVRTFSRSADARADGDVGADGDAGADADAGGDDARGGRSARSRGERAGLLTLLAVVVCFGLQSAIDWTWYVPAVAVPALLGAGWLAGRGPLGSRIGVRARRRSLLGHPAIPLLVTTATVLVLALDWGILQPLRAVQSENAAVGAAGRGATGAAIADARAAVARDPFSTDAMSLLSSLLLGAGETSAARSELVLETRRQPKNYVSWRDLGSFDLDHHDVRAALKELTIASEENPSDVTVHAEQAQAATLVAGLKRGAA